MRRNKGWWWLQTRTPVRGLWWNNCYSGGPSYIWPVIYIDFENFGNFASWPFIYIVFRRYFWWIIETVDRCFALSSLHKSLKCSIKSTLEAWKKCKKILGRLRRPKYITNILFLSNYLKLIPGSSYISILKILKISPPGSSYILIFEGNFRGLLRLLIGVLHSHSFINH